MDNPCLLEQLGKGVEVPQKYEVIGPRTIEGKYKKGDVFEADYDAAKLASLIQAGHIRIVSANTAQLREAASEAGIEGADMLKKADLLDALAAKTTVDPEPDEGETPA